MSLSDWTIANPESAGLRSEPLRDLVEWLDGFGQANIHSVLVVRHGRLLFEHYRAGEDQCWGEPLGNVAHGPDSKHDLRSVTKSALAIADTHVHGIQYFPYPCCILQHCFLSLEGFGGLTFSSRTPLLGRIDIHAYLPAILGQTIAADELKFDTRLKHRIDFGQSRVQIAPAVLIWSMAPFGFAPRFSCSGLSLCTRSHLSR